MIPQICLAPLRGVTDAVFRRTYAEFFDGIDWALAPFVSTTRGTRFKTSHLADILPENNVGLTVEPQIMSKNADRFVTLATVLFDLGYHTVNWNLGCPYPMVARKQRGSGLLPHPDKIRDFLERAVPRLAGGLSIKMRLGRFDKEEILDLVPILNQFPLVSLTIHPRTGVQMYSGRPDLETFERCLGLANHPVIYNGDIMDKLSFDILVRRFPLVSGWMIGRGAIIDPFLPGVLKGLPVDPAGRVARFRQFHDALYARYAHKLHGPGHLLNRMKGLWGYFAKAFAEGRQWRKRINKTQRTDHYESVIDRFFASDPQWRDRGIDEI